MTVRVTREAIFVEGAGAVADAEPILSALQADASRTIDLSGATRLHSAIIQLLIALRPQVAGLPADPFFAAHLLALLDTGEG